MKMKKENRYKLSDFLADIANQAEKLREQRINFLAKIWFDY